MSIQTDFYAWTQSQANALASHNAEELDWDALAEEVESMGRSERRAIKSEMVKALKHMLKRAYFPDAQCDRGCAGSIANARVEIQQEIEDSPSLADYPREALRQAYEQARASIGAEYGPVPEACPWTIEEVLGS